MRRATAAYRMETGATITETVSALGAVARCSDTGYMIGMRIRCGLENARDCYARL